MIDIKQVLEMAKLIYFNIDGGPPGGWERLNPVQKDEYLNKVVAIVENFGRLDLAVVPKTFREPDGRKPVDRVRMENAIRGFLERFVKKPAGILNLVPYKELAYELCKEFKIDEPLVPGGSPEKKA